YTSHGKSQECPLVKNWDGKRPLVDLSWDRCPYEWSHHGENILCPFGFWGVKHVIEQPPSMPPGRQLPLSIRITNQPPALVVGLSLSRELDENLSTKHLYAMQADPLRVKVLVRSSL